MSQKTCKQCGNSIILNETAQKVISNLNMLEPELCNTCGMAYLMSFRNERTFYSSKCQKCDKQIIGMYPADTKYIVWCRDCWWSDTWDAKEFALDYKGPETFFEQMKELQLKVPREGLVSLNTENCDYSNHIRDSKDCYMCVGVADNCEHLFYSYGMLGMKYSSDVIWGIKSELLYNCVFVNYSYNCSFLLVGENCTDCDYSYDLKNCSNCMFSNNLQNKSYVFENKQLTKEEYEKKVDDLHLGSYSGQKKSHEKYKKLLNDAMHRYSLQVNSQDCSGENIHGSKNCHLVFGSWNSEDCLNVANLLNSQNVVYSFAIGTQSVENAYLTSVTKGGTNVAGCFNTVLSNDILFCDSIVSSTDCIGCIGLNKKSFCILNKQYSPEEYKKIKNELMDYWRKNEQLSQFMPKDLSCFSYNETHASELYPLEREEALKLGYKWQDNMPVTRGKGTLEGETIPDNIKDVQDSIISEILTCTNCNRNYKVIKPELTLYRKLNLPIPRECFDCRHMERLRLMGGRILYDRSCTCNSSEHGHTGRCSNNFSTIYKEGVGPEKVFCESCYQKEVV